MRCTVNAAQHDAATVLRDESCYGAVQYGRVWNQADKCDVSIAVNQECGRGVRAVPLVNGPVHVIDQHGPWDALVALVPCSVLELLLGGDVRRLGGAWMRLSHDDIDELDRPAPSGVQLLQRLDRADCDRSGDRGEAQKQETAPALREAQLSAVSPR